ncbi:hypothetical protein KAX97_09945 [candidate division WOR-3 bacterium]|nr:hypothetical protein [candidate division WOR-3 bacterium]
MEKLNAVVGIAEYFPEQHGNEFSVSISPNPFRNLTAITFSTGQSVPPGQGENPRLSDGTEHMTLQIYDVSGSW